MAEIFPPVWNKARRLAVYRGINRLLPRPFFEASPESMPLFKHPIIDHIPSLRRYARALTGGRPDDADDLVQDTLERAYAKWHLWRVGSDLVPGCFPSCITCS